MRKRSKNKKGYLVGHTVGLLDDTQIQDAVDDLLSSAATSNERLMNRLLELEWIPQGEAHITILALLLTISSYNELRNESDDVQLCLFNAYVKAMENPTISRYMAKVAASNIDNSLGVSK